MMWLTHRHNAPAGVCRGCGALLDEKKATQTYGLAIAILQPAERKTVIR